MRLWTGLRERTSLRFVKRLTHILAFLVLAAFTAGAFSHAAGTTEMSVRMAVADVDMNDCDDCDEPGNASGTCDQVCVQPFAALAASPAIEVAPEAVSLRQSLSHDLVGRLGPPERHPPRQPS